jgi:hypothetical protein
LVGRKLGRSVDILWSQLKQSFQLVGWLQALVLVAVLSVPSMRVEWVGSQFRTKLWTVYSMLHTYVGALGSKDEYEDA